MTLKNIHKKTILKIQKEYCKTNEPWNLAYSGGKDSSALLKLVYLAIKELNKKDKVIRIIYCDSGVEIPIIKEKVYEFLKNIKKELIQDSIPFEIKIVSPKIQEKFFVNLIGKGYPSPTNKFRWCTRRLKTNPIKSVLDKNNNSKNIILLGTRLEESMERKKIIEKYRILKTDYFLNKNFSNSIAYCPILNYSEEDIWDILLNYFNIKSFELLNLDKIYSVRTISKKIFSKKIRCGCWTCTVVRKDKALEELIKTNTPELNHLLLFKNWLLQIRDLKEFRIIKSNGSLGSFNLLARKMILNRLLKIQGKVPWELISEEETKIIKKLWKEK